MSPSEEVGPTPLTRQTDGEDRAGEGTGLTGAGEHGSSVLLRYAASEGFSDIQIEQTRLSVGERSVVQLKLRESPAYGQYLRLPDST